VNATATHLLTLDVRDFGAYLGKSIQGLLILHPRDYEPARTRQLASESRASRDSP
jgi:hypothetical protein